MKEGEVKKHLVYKAGYLVLEVRTCQKTSTVDAVSALIYPKIPEPVQKVTMTTEEVDSELSVIIVTYTFASTRISLREIEKRQNLLTESIEALNNLCRVYLISLNVWKDVLGSLATGPATDNNAQQNGEAQNEG